MGDFLRLLLDSITYLWPFRIVHQYERGVYYVLGRQINVPRWYGGPECTAGRLWLVLPFFTDVKVISVVRNTLVTALQTITTIDGGTLTFSATAQVEIENASWAYNNVSKYEETATEDIAAILAEKLAEVDSHRLQPENRGRLVGTCRQSLTAQLGLYGVKVLSLRFNNFVTNIRVYRLFNDQSFHGATT